MLGPTAEGRNIIAILFSMKHNQVSVFKENDVYISRHFYVKQNTLTLIPFSEFQYQVVKSSLITVHTKCCFREDLT